MEYSKPRKYKYSITNLNEKKSDYEQNIDSHKHKAHFFHFMLWRDSIRVRYIIEAIVLYFIAFNIASAAIQMVHSTPNFDAYEKAIEELQIMLDAAELVAQGDYNASDLPIPVDSILEPIIYEGFIGEIQLQYTTANKAFISEFTQLLSHSNLMLPYGACVITGLIFMKLNHRRLYAYYSEILITFITCFLTVTLLYKFLNTFENFDYKTREEYYEIKAKKIVDDYHTNLLPMISIMIACQLIRAFTVFKISRTLGPLGNILKMMLHEVLKFLFLEMGIYYIFMYVGQVLFYQVPEFSNTIDAILTLMSASLGNFDFSIFDNASSSTRYYGYAYLSVHLILSMVTLMNFLIAILTNTYDNLKSISIGLHLKELIFARQFFHGDQRYTSMVSTFSPLNLILLPFIPFILCCKSEKLNNKILHYTYKPVIIIGFILFVLISFFLTPIAYIIILFKVVRSIFKPHISIKERVARVIDSIIFLIFGLVILFVQLGWDSYNFWND